MPRPERVLDANSGPIESFAAALREVRRQAGGLGYRELAERAGFSVGTLADAAGGRRFPSLAVTLAFVRACDGDVAAWEQRWREVAEDVAALRAPDRAGGAEPPYRGLTGYSVDDGPLFFGRGRIVSRLVELLARQRFLAVFGVSGSGKSSLLRAGLVPAVAGAVPMAGSLAGCLPVLMTPGARPVEALRKALSAVPPDRDVLLVVDQFEEVFTLCRDSDDRAEFVAELAALTRHQPECRTRVVVAVRADFYARCAEVPELAALLAGANVPVPPLSETELREVVHSPAHVAGATVERALVTKVLADASGQPGALPLISHALLETWRRRRSDVLTVAGYEAAGGVVGAIAKTAEAVFERFGSEQRETARQLLVRMVTLGEGVEDTRRRVHRSELDFLHVDAVLDELAAARLVVLDEETVEVAHEALISAWPRLHGWLHADREMLRLHRQLTEASQIWQALDRDPGALYRGARLAVWDGRPLDSLNEVERAFVAASYERQAHEETARRRRLRAVLAGLTAAITIMAVLAALAVVQASRAASERDVAVSRQLAAEARRQLQLDPAVGLQLARQAIAVRPTTEAEAVLRQALVDQHARAMVPGHRGHALGVAFSRDGQQLASTNQHGVVRLWSRPAGHGPWGEAVVLWQHKSEAWSPVFSPDGGRLATAGIDGTIRVGNTDRHGQAVVLRGHQGKVWNVAFSPDGWRVASASDDSTVRVWDLRGRRPPVILRGHRGPVVGVAFSPDGRRVASGGHDRTVRIWDLTRPAGPVVLRGHEDAVKRLAFSPDGTRLASASVDGTARVWPTEGSGAPVVLRGHGGTVEGIAFSADGQRVATTSDDMTVRVWNPAGDSDPLVLRGHKGTVWAASFSPDGRQLATASTDGTVRMWDPRGAGEPLVAGRHDGPAWMAAFVPGGQRVVSGGSDKTVRIWSVTDSRAPVVLRGHSDEVLGLAVSSDGRRIASAGRDGTVRIWDTDAGVSREPVVLRGHKGPAWMTAFSPDGTRLVSAGTDATVRIWETATGRAGPVLRAADSSVRYVAFSPDGRHVAGGSKDGMVRIWDTGAGAAREPVVLRGHENLVWALAYSPDGRRIATAGSDMTVRIWDVAAATARTDRDAGELVLRGHQGMVWNLAFSPDGRWVASAGKDSTVRVWRTAAASEPIVYGGFGSSVESVAFSPDGQRFVTAHGDGTVRVWRCDACRDMDDVRELADARAHAVDPGHPN